MANLSLRPFESPDIDLVNAWVTTDELARSFAGPTIQRPITFEALVRSRDDEVAFIVESDGEPVGTAQLRGIDAETATCRIGCVLLFDPAQRGRGKGVALMNLMISHAEQYFGSTSVTLFVLENNEQAIRCYQRCGFTFTGTRSPIAGGGVEMKRSGPA